MSYVVTKKIERTLQQYVQRDEEREVATLHHLRRLAGDHGLTMDNALRLRQAIAQEQLAEILERSMADLSMYVSMLVTQLERDDEP